MTSELTGGFTVKNRFIQNDPYALDEETRTELYGPEPINPFKRLRTDIDLSCNKLAGLCHVDRKALSRLEAGTYTYPLPSMVDFWVGRGVATEGELLSEYEDYQFQQRRRHPLYLGATLAFNIDGIHPLRQLRLLRPDLTNGLPLPVGITEFSESLCLPLDTIQFFEKKWRLQQTVPKQLKLVLNQIGYTRTQIATFEQNYQKWRGLNSRTVTVSV